jgi:hypothetical protein
MLKKISFLLMAFILFLLLADILFFNLPKSNKFSSLPQQINQYGQDIQKDIWINDENHRIHIRLKSDSSDLFLSQKDKKIKIEETLKNITLAIQDRADKNTQEVRYFTSSEGVYQFPSQKFFIKDINIFFFHLPGNILPCQFNQTDAYLKGNAVKAGIFISKKKPSFDIENLKLTQKSL